MTRELVGGFVVALVVGLGTNDATAQGIRVAVGVNAPPIAAQVVFGDGVYYVDRAYLARDAVYVLPVHSHRRMVIYGPYAYRYRHHYTWVDYERARLGRLYLSRHEYRKAMREFERERAKRERELERPGERRQADEPLRPAPHPSPRRAAAERPADPRRPSGNGRA